MLTERTRDPVGVYSRNRCVGYAPATVTKRLPAGTSRSSSNSRAGRRGRPGVRGVGTAPRNSERISLFMRYLRWAAGTAAGGNPLGVPAGRFGRTENPPPAYGPGRGARGDTGDGTCPTV